MAQMESPKRKMQKRNDYQRHKLFRKIKRRRKAQAEAEQQIAVKQLRKKLKLPKFDRGEDELSTYKKQVEMFNDANSDPTLPGRLVDRNRVTVNPETGDVMEVGGHINLDPVIITGKMPDNLKQTINKNIESDRIQDLLYKDRLSPVDPIGELVVESAAIGKPLELAGKAALYGIGRYGEKLGLKKLQGLARQKLLEREFALSTADKQLAKDIVYSKPRVEDNSFRNYSWTNSNDGYPYALRPGQNSWDTNIIQDELHQGRKDLLDWVNNPEFIKAQQANKIEAQSMGLEYIPIHERSTFKDRVALLDNPGTYKWYANNKAQESGYVENPLGDYGSVMNINLANVDPYRFTISHEGGHMLGMGGPDLPSNSSQSILSQLKYLKHKSRQVLKPGYWYNNQFDISEYPYEAVQNLRNLGQELKLSVGQKYPGYKNALDIINNSGNTTHSFLKPYLKTDKESMPYVWKALVGTQFGLSPVYLNATNDKSFNSGKDIHIKPSRRGTFTKAAKQHGMSVQGFANKVLRNPSKYSAAMRKKANFARNASKWNK